MKRTHNAGRLAAFSLFLMLTGLVTWNQAIAVEPPAKPVKASAILWEVKKSNRVEGYLFGTIHLNDPRFKPFIKAVERRIQESSMLCLEIEPNAESTMKVMQAMLLPKGQQLDQILGADLFARTQARVQKLGIPPVQLKQMKPWAAYFTLIMSTANKGMAVDQELYLSALTQQKSVCALETVEDQIGVFDAFNFQEQTVFLAMTLDYLDKDPNPMAPLIEAYVRQDLDALVKISDAMNQDVPQALEKKFERLLLTQRNYRMASTIDQQLRQEAKPVTVAVGALHLVGNEGLLALLEAKGYQLSPLSTQAN